MRSLFSTSARVLACLVLAFASLLPAHAQRQSENLGRGVVALRTTTTEAYISWRLLGQEPADIAFNLYRSVGGGAAIKVNATPLTVTTDFRDTLAATDFTSTITYTVRPVVGGVEQAAGAPYTLAANAVVGQQYFTIPLSTPTPNPGSALPYDTKFGWVGDLDGDGEYDFVVDRLSTAALVNNVGERQYIEAYKRDGTFLWRMDMGLNSLNQYAYEPGSSAISIGDTDNVTVFDLDGDGRAEVLVRTANGVTVANAAGTQVASVTAGNDTDQFVSVIDGETGVERARLALPNPWAEHGTLTNKCAIASLDGVRPSLIVYGYNRADSKQFYRSFSAFDYRHGTLSLRWNWAQDQSSPATPGAEGHQIRIADVDNDGRDEICDLGFVLDDDGTQLFSTDLTHGDRFHVADIDPDRPGLETYAIQQSNPRLLATALYDSGTGEMINRRYSTAIVDVGRGIAVDIDPAHFGLEMYCTQPGIFDAKGNLIYANSIWAPEGLWWDGDLSREFIDGAGSGAYNPAINKFNPATGVADRLWSIYNDGGAYSIRQAYGGRPAFEGDIVGDWREELVFITSDYSALRVYTTSIPATNRLYTLMQNPAYRGQATAKGYWEAQYVDYYLGTGMTPPPPPPVTSARLIWQGGAGAANTWDAESAASWREGVLGTTATSYSDGEAVLFDMTGNAASPVLLSGNLTPGAVTVYSPTSYLLDGASGALTGGMTFAKLGSGAVTLTGSHSYSGATTIWDGGFVVDGQLAASPVVVWGGTWGGPLAKGLTGGRLAGSGSITRPVVLNYRASLTPGNGMNSAGTLSLHGGLTTAAATTLAFDLSDDPTGLVRASDRLSIDGDLTLGGATTLHLNLLNGGLSAGTYTLVTYTGTLTGIAHLAVTGLEGTPCALSSSGGVISITVPAVRAPDAIVWQGGAGAEWDLNATAAWLRSGAADVFVPGDAVAFNATGSATPTVTLNEAVKPAAMVVASDTDYTISGGGSILGSGGLTKTGTGTLTMATTNRFTGPVAINGGRVSIASMSDSGMPGPLGSAPATSGNFTLDGGTLRYTGADATSTNRVLTLGAAGGTLDVSTTNVGFQLAGVIEGTGSLVKNGPGMLTLSAVNTYSGGTVLNSGVIVLGDDTSNTGALGSGLVTLNGGTLRYLNSTSNSESTSVPANFHVPAGATGRIEVDGRSTMSGTLTGTGTLNYYTPYVRTEMAGDWSAFAGRINVITDADGGDFRFVHTAGLPLAELDLAALTSAYCSAVQTTDVTLPIGALSGVSGSQLLGGSTVGFNVTWAIGSRNTDTAFAGTIGNGSAAVTGLTKVGTGTLTLTGANTYTGATTVSAGTLLINGSSAASAITVQSGATLGASGVITGTVAFESGSRVILGASPLSVTGSVSVGGNVSIVSGSSLTDGSYTVLNASSVSGTPVWNYVGPLSPGQVASFSVSGGSLVLTMKNESGFRSPAATTWTGAVSGDWDAPTTNWKLNTDGSATAFVANDAVTFNDTLVGNPEITITENVAPASVAFANATTAYTITADEGSLSGGMTLTKNGAGLVTLVGDHAYTGATTIHAGTLLINGANASSAIAVQSGGALGGAGTVSRPVTFASGSRLAATAAGTLSVSNTVTLPATMIVSAPTNVADGTYTLLTATTFSGAATWTYAGPLYIGQSAVVSTTADRVVLTLSGTVSTRLPGAIQWSGAVSGAWNTSTVFNWTASADASATAFTHGDSVTFDDALTGTAAVAVASVVSPKSVTFANGATPYSVTSTSPGIAGATSLVKNGSGTTTLFGVNTYTGGTVINAGVLALGDKAANSTALSSGPITLNGGTLKFTYASTASVWSVVANAIVVPAGANARIQFDQRGTISGPLTGSGTLTVWFPYVRGELTGNWSAFSGQLNVTSDIAANGDVVLNEGGDFRLMNGAGFPNASVDLGSKVYAYYNTPPAAGVNIAFGSLSGAADATLAGTTTGSRQATWTIGARNLDSTYAGKIINGAGPSALTKVGTGTLTLTNTNTYTGATIVNAGTLRVNGSHANGIGATTVNAGTLMVAGSLTNTTSVEVKPGATLNLTGTLTTGTLTIRAGGRLIGGGTITGTVINEGLIEATGSASFTVTGNLTNAAGGVIRLKRGAGLAYGGGTFTNNGIVDLITSAGAATNPGVGTVLTQASLVVVDFAYVSDAGAVLTLGTGYAGHDYQLQRSLDLAEAASWVNVGASVEGTGAAMIFVDEEPPSPADRCFYRVMADQ